MESNVKKVNLKIITALFVFAVVLVCLLCFAFLDLSEEKVAFAEDAYRFHVDYTAVVTEYTSNPIAFPLTGVSCNNVALTESEYTVTYTSSTVAGYEEGSTEVPSQAGDYSVRVSVIDDEEEVITYKDFVFTITPRALDLYVSGSATYEYNGSSFVRNVSPLGICIGDDANVIVKYTGARHDLEPGVRPVCSDIYDMSFSIDNPNYKVGEIFDDNGRSTLTITQKTLTAKVGDVSVTYGRKPEFKITLTGFVNNENESVVTEKPFVRNIPTEVGAHRVNAVGGSAENYNFQYVEGVLTINKLQAEGSIANSATYITYEGVFAPESTYIGEEIDLKSDAGKDCLATVRRFRLTDFTSSPKYIYKISAVAGGVRNDSAQEGEEDKIKYTTITFHNLNLDASQDYFIVFLSAKGGVTKVTKYDYANGTLTFKATDAAGTVVIYRDAQTLIITTIVISAVGIFFLLLFIASKIKYHNEKKDIEAKIRRKKREKNKYRW